MDFFHLQTCPMPVLVHVVERSISLSLCHTSTVCLFHTLCKTRHIRNTCSPLDYAKEYHGRKYANRQLMFVKYFDQYGTGIITSEGRASMLLRKSRKLILNVETDQENNKPKISNRLYILHKNKICPPVFVG